MHLWMRCIKVYTPLLIFCYRVLSNLYRIEPLPIQTSVAISWFIKALRCLAEVNITEVLIFSARVLTGDVTVRLVWLQAGDAGAFHAELQVVEFLSELLNVTLLTVQLHLQLVAIRGLLYQLLQIQTTTLTRPKLLSFVLKVPSQ